MFFFVDIHSVCLLALIKQIKQKKSFQFHYDLKLYNVHGNKIENLIKQHKKSSFGYQSWLSLSPYISFFKSITISVSKTSSNHLLLTVSQFSFTN